MIKLKNLLTEITLSVKTTINDIDDLVPGQNYKMLLYLDSQGCTSPKDSNGYYTLMYEGVFYLPYSPKEQSYIFRDPDENGESECTVYLTEFLLRSLIADQRIKNMV